MQPFDQKQYELLAEKMLRGLISAEEQDLLDQWATFLENKADLEDSDSAYAPLKERSYQRLKEELGFKQAAQQKIRPLYTAWKVAAAVLMIALLSTGYYFYSSNRFFLIKKDIAPAANGALLTLSDGRTILLDSSKTNIDLEGVGSLTNADGTLSYHPTNNKRRDVTEMNTLTTPQGKQYKLRLPDGTRVWLNAGSSIQYPVAFTGKYRQVTLSGEAYFEVVHDASQPFRVNAGAQKIEDIGTAFNISAYKGYNVKTTLIEGSVSVKAEVDTAAVILQPGQQAVGTNTIKVLTADTEAAAAWKNGYFIFNDASISSIMHEIERWYNVKVFFAPEVPKDLKFGGIISRKKNISAVLKMMETTGKIRFELSADNEVHVFSKQE